MWALERFGEKFLTLHSRVRDAEKPGEADRHAVNMQVEVTLDVDEMCLRRSESESRGGECCFREIGNLKGIQFHLDQKDQQSWAIGGLRRGLVFVFERIACDELLSDGEMDTVYA